jgi:hypothetical protein
MATSGRNDTDSARRPRATTLPNTPILGARALSLVVERLISGCGQQASELGSLPFAAIARIAAPDEVQTGALEALRETIRRNLTAPGGRSSPHVE